MIMFFEDVRGEKYKKFIRWACQKSDAVMLVFDYLDEDWKLQGEIIRKQLGFYRLASRSNPMEWPLTRSHAPREVYIDVYKICPEVEEYLLSVEGLYDWNYPNHPIDPAFFKNNVCWFASTIHEQQALIWREDDEYYMMLEDLNIPFDIYPEEDDTDLYIEDY